MAVIDRDGNVDRSGQPGEKVRGPSVFIEATSFRFAYEEFPHKVPNGDLGPDITSTNGFSIFRRHRPSGNHGPKAVDIFPHDPANRSESRSVNEVRWGPPQPGCFLAVLGSSFSTKNIDFTLPDSGWCRVACGGVPQFWNRAFSISLSKSLDLSPLTY